MGVAAFHRTLEQELTALARGISLECLVCGEFVLKLGEAISCNECGTAIQPPQEARLQLSLQAG